MLMICSSVNFMTSVLLLQSYSDGLAFQFEGIYRKQVRENSSGCGLISAGRWPAARRKRAMIVRLTVREDCRNRLMAKFRKKLSVIEAWQWDGNAAVDARPEWLRVGDYQTTPDRELVVPTRAGVRYASPGDGIIR